MLFQNIVANGISGCDTYQFALNTSEGYNFTNSVTECPCRKLIAISGHADVTVTLSAIQKGSIVTLSSISKTAGWFFSLMKETIWLISHEIGPHI